MFITFEGPDGAGKTSIIQKLKAKLEQTGEYPVHFTREPGGSPIAEEIRHVTLDPKNTTMDAKTEALLIAAGRRQHIVEKILPILKNKEIVICDRFVDSSLVYQGYARGIGMEAVAQINQFATEDLQPDVTFYLDVPSEVGLERIQKAKHDRQYDRLDQEKLSFHQKVREGYGILLERHKDRMIRIDANRPEQDVFEECQTLLLELLEQNKLSGGIIYD